jgi:hypothetical protein
LNEYITEAPALPKSTAGADFWLNLGTNILAQPGGRPILQTLGTAGKEPLHNINNKDLKKTYLNINMVKVKDNFN